ncbi:MAG: hypothetical protein NVS3B23_03590 [Candidatus Saccharimonadales bacterium]
MFKKLVSNLSFNPSLIGQLSFYSKRIKAESTVRRYGMIFIALAFVIQLFAVISPPQSSLAASTNDIIYGGLHSSDPRATLLSIYDANSDGHNTGIRELFDSYNISRSDLANTTLSSINSGDHAIYSLGRETHSTLDQSHVVGSQQYYLRPLYTWGDNLSYQVLTGTRTGMNGTADDRYFSVMLDCGNIVLKARPYPNLTLPTKVARTENGLPAQNTTVAPGQTIGYRIFFSNNGAGIAHNVTLTDPIPAHTAHTWHGTGASTNGGQIGGNNLVWLWSQMPAQAQNWYVDLNVTVNNDTPDGTRICNSALLSYQEHPQQSDTQQVCHTVHVPTVTQTVIPRTPAPIVPVAPQPVIPAPPPTVVTGQAEIDRNKLASNVTQNLSDAQTKPANPGDVISYQLITINKGTATYPHYVVTEQVKDVLEYADVIDISNDGKLVNGSLIWNNFDVKAGATVTRSFRVQVKNPLPTTPKSSSDPQSYDLRMDNVYGNLVSIQITPPNIPKAIEQTTTSPSLPNTGPGTTIAIGFAITTIVGYFFARSRLLSKELDIIRNEYTSTGGY